MKNAFIHIFTLFISLLVALTFTLDPPHKIELDPEGVDSFVMDPADFNPDDEDARILRHEPFGRKDPAVYESVEREDGTFAIKATSDNAISSLTTPIKADPAVYQYLEWEWKIDSVLPSGDMFSKDGDDYTVRIYVNFDYDPSNLGFRDRTRYRIYQAFTSFDIPLRSLNYVWANKADVGTIAESPFTDWVRYVALQSGNEHAGQWKFEKRNILEDYREVFGEDPPAISGITIMTDSDNTGESTKGWFGKITLSKN